MNIRADEVTTDNFYDAMIQALIDEANKQGVQENDH